MRTHHTLGYFDAAFDSGEITEPKSRYAIFSSPRTGSNYLCARLSNLKNCLGIPMEYLHPDAIRLMGARLLCGAKEGANLDSYLQSVARVRTTSDGWFGTKVQPEQLLIQVGISMDSACTFLGSFDRLILMTRRDKLGQAISGALAYSTGEWFNFGSEPNLERGIAELFPLIDRLQMQYEAEEKLMGGLSRLLQGRLLLHIAYEEILEDPQGVLQRTIEFLGPIDASVTEETTLRLRTQKPPGALAERIRTAYLNHLGDRQ